MRLLENVRGLLTEFGLGFKIVEIPGVSLSKVRHRLAEVAGFDGLYSHQLEVVNLVEKGSSVVLVAPTGSGKTLAFALGYFTILEKSPDATALLIYPRKSLERDQLMKLATLFSKIGLTPADLGIADGDVAFADKWKSLRFSRLLVTNPHALHYYLAYHGSWASFLSRVGMVVLDEAHLYTGVYGTNVAYIIRRLRRVLEYYGVHPIFVVSSATLGLPQDSANLLVGLPFELVRVNGMTLNPKDLILGVMPHTEEKRIALLAELLKRMSHIRGIVFFNSRDEMERVYYRLFARLPEATEVVGLYRAGYSAEERRQIESLFKSGKLRWVFATSALEVGIDIGDLGSVVLWGFPVGGVTSFWQRIGRAGRNGRALVVYLARPSNALDMYVYDNPDYLRDAEPYPIYADLHNTVIGKPQVKSALWELAPNGSEERFFPRELIDVATSELSFIRSGGRLVAVGPKPHGEVKMDFGDDVYGVFDEHGRLLEKLEFWRVMSYYYPGAFYHFRGKAYRVKCVDMDRRMVSVESADNTWRTDPIGWENIEVLRVNEEKKLGDLRLVKGRVRVDKVLVGYSDGEGWHIYRGALRRIFETSAVWFDLPPVNLSVLDDRVWTEHISVGDDVEVTISEIWAGALHALEHLLINVAPVVVAAAPSDLGGYSIPSPVKRKLEGMRFARRVCLEDVRDEIFTPTVEGWEETSKIYIYDGHPDGIGIIDRLFDAAEQWFKAAWIRVSSCRCSKGCPACIMSPQCGNGNRPLNKVGARLLLETFVL